MKIQCLGFLPAIIIVVALIWGIINFDMERRGFSTHNTSSLIVTIIFITVFLITILGLAWGLSRI